MSSSILLSPLFRLFFFFFNDTATTEIYTLSLHDALPIYDVLKPAICGAMQWRPPALIFGVNVGLVGQQQLCYILDRKSTRLNSSHGYISYAVFCLKKKKTQLAVQ